MRFAVFLCYSVRCLYVILCGFAVLIPPYSLLSPDDAIPCTSHTLSSSRHLLFYSLGLAVQVLASQVKSVDIEEFFKGFLITSGSTTGRWYSTSMQGLLGNLQDGGLKARFQALARPCQTSPPSGSWVLSNFLLFPSHGRVDWVKFQRYARPPSPRA